MNQEDIEASPDDALIACVRLRGYERVLSRLGCLAAAAVSTIPAASAAQTWTSDLDGLMGSVAHGLVFSFAALCSFPLVGLVFGPLIALRRLRAGKEIAELKRRWGQAELLEYERRAAVMLAGGGRDANGRPPPDHVVIFQGCELPHGMHRFLRVDVWGSELPHAEAEFRSAHAVLEAADATPPGSVRVISSVLQDSLTKALAAKLDVLDGDLSGSSSGTRDGFPCKCAVLRRDPPDVFHAEANLASTPQGELSAQLLGLLAAATEAMTVQGPSETT